MKQALVIGYGNPCRGDDGIGWHLISRLAEERRLPAGVEAMSVLQLTPELAERLSRVDLVLFVDARWDRIPGRIGQSRLEPSEASAASFSHQVDPAALLGMARLLYGRAPEAWLITVAGESFEHAEVLSRSVSASVPGLLKRVEHLLAGLQPAAPMGRPPLYA